MNINEILRHKEPISHYDIMQVCEINGHKITDCYDTYPEVRQDHCQICGSKTIIKCPSCQTEIRGYRHFKTIVGGPGPYVPLYCHQCGKPYPWKDALIKERKALQKVKSNTWNFVNPPWLVWEFLKFLWRHRVHSVIITIIAGLIVYYLAWRFGWTK